MSTSPSSTPTIGVDLGGTKVAVGVVGGEREVLYQASEPVANYDTDGLIDALERAIRKAMESVPEARGVGLGIPCTIDQERGVAINAVNLPLTDVPLRDLMEQRLGTPVFIDNDANLAALGEQLHGAGRGSRSTVMLTVGTGVGGGIVIDGEVFRGPSGAGVELGHVSVEADGPPCQGSCPNRGCVETMSSGTALGRDGSAAAIEHPDSALGRIRAEGGTIDGRAVVEAAMAGDEVARKLVQRAGYYLGVAMASIANIFEPEVITVGGGVCAAGELLIAPARTELVARALPPMNQARVTRAELGPDAGMYGGAALAAIELGKRGG